MPFPSQWYSEFLACSRRSTTRYGALSLFDGSLNLTKALARRGLRAEAMDIQHGGLQHDLSLHRANRISSSCSAASWSPAFAGSAHLAATSSGSRALGMVALWRTLEAAPTTPSCSITTRWPSLWPRCGQHLGLGFGNWPGSKQMRDASAVSNGDDMFNKRFQLKPNGHGISVGIPINDSNCNQMGLVPLLGFNQIVEIETKRASYLRWDSSKWFQLKPKGPGTSVGIQTNGSN